MTTQIDAPRAPRMDPKYNRSRKSRTNFEMIAWLFMRLSGVVLIVLIFGHLISNLLVGQGVHAIDFGFVAGKWANPLWQVWDLTMLWLAMLHGTNGVRTIINDYAEKDRTRFWLKGVLYVVAAFILLLGTMVIFTFDPCIDPTAAQAYNFCPHN